MDHAEGEEITANLRLLRSLERGGMGILWVAEHRALGCEVVVKFLGGDRDQDPAAARRIAREAAAAARVKSPHVVQIFDHGVSGGVPFIVMELLAGRNLRRHLEASGPLSFAEATVIVHQLAKALEKTHAAGLVHRDVKPSNIFLCENEGDVFVKLLDFGLAQRSVSGDRSTTETRRCAGTPPYMSPEQILGSGLDARSDIWSLGVVGFECLTGARPFDGETLGAIALSVHTLPLPRLTDRRQELPALVDDWFARACARSAGDRFRSAMEAARELSRSLGLRPPDVSFHPPGSAAPPDPTVSSDFTLARRVEAREPLRRGTSRAWTLSALAAVSAIAIAARARVDRQGAERPAPAVVSVESRPIAPVAAVAPDPAVQAPAAPSDPAVTLADPSASVARSAGPVEAASQAAHEVPQRGSARSRAAQAPAPPARPSDPAVSTAAPPSDGRGAFELPDERH